jgi:hypothetical protein
MQGFTADDAFNAFVYPEKHPSGVQFLKNQFNNFTGVLTTAAQDFLQASRQQVERFTGSAALEFARNVVKSVMGTNNITTEMIVTLFDLNQMQGASLPMQRWIMTNPTVREYYHLQRCEGFVDTYVDVEPGLVGEEHYDYRRVMDGVMQDAEDGGWYAKIYVEDLKEGDRDLSHGEKVDILQTWSRLEYLMALNKEDPTSPEGGYL